MEGSKFCRGVKVKTFPLTAPVDASKVATGLTKSDVLNNLTFFVTTLVEVSFKVMDKVVLAFTVGEPLAGERALATGPVLSSVKVTI